MAIYYFNASFILFFRYKEALISLVKNVLEKLQFKYNQSQLEELDDETLDYDVSYMVT